MGIRAKVFSGSVFILWGNGCPKECDKKEERKLCNTLKKRAVS